MSAKIDYIKGRDVFGDAWEAGVPAHVGRGAVAYVRAHHDFDEAAVALDAPSALRLGAFLLARGLGAADGSVQAGTLVLVAPEGAGPLDVLDVAERARAAHAGPVVVVPFGWTRTSPRSHPPNPRAVNSRSALHARLRAFLVRCRRPAYR